MLTGQLYDPSDSELEQLRLKARKLARNYNLTDEDECEKQYKSSKNYYRIREKFLYCRHLPILITVAIHILENIVGANFNFTCLDVCPVHIGDNVMIGPNVTLATPMHPLLPSERNCRLRENGSVYNLEYAKPITIENDCWLAANVVVCGGVTIGEGAVIGAGSVVNKRYSTT